METNPETFKVLLEVKGLLGEHTAKLDAISTYIKQHDKDIQELKDFRTGVKAKVGLVAAMFAFITTAATQIAIKMFFGNR